MKLLKLDTTTCPIGASSPRIPTMRIGRQGSVSLSKTAVELMELSVGNKVSIVQDEDNIDDFYIHIDEKAGFELRKDYKDNNKKKFLLFRNAELARRLYEAYDYDSAIIKSLCFEIGSVTTKEKGMTLYPLLNITKDGTEVEVKQ